MANVVGTTANDFIHPIGDGRTVPPGFNEVTGVTEGHDTIDGKEGDDQIFDSGGNDTILGGDGNDFISDVGFSSNINGGAGDDTIYGNSANDYTTGGEGNDIIDGGLNSSSFSGGDSLFGGAGNDYIVTGFLTLSELAVGLGTAGSVLDGAAGADQLYSLVGQGKDYAVGGEGDDIIATGGGNDYIFGGDGNDTIVAGSGIDYIYGNAGNDFIYTDDLALFKSQDFVYVSGLSGFGTGIDTVADFTPGSTLSPVSANTGDVVVILSTPGLASFADVQANMTDIGVYTVISLSAGNQLYLYNVDPGQLTADNFLFL
jgi:Ca2+-binding RTX toxin-like protein